MGNDLAKRRTEFRAAVDKDQRWRDQAREDVEFYCSKQWNESTKRKLEEAGRPVITDNRLKPLINLLSGYQRLNRYDADFQPRTSDDVDLCTVRKGLTKYISDQCDYGTQESLMFMDGIICGRGWLEVYYDIDYETLEGEAQIRRVSPFDIFVDPESREPDYSDARYLCRAKWTDKDELKAIYPEHADEIEVMTDEYDEDERHECTGIEPLWYQRNTRKIRMVEHWRKEIYQQQYYLIANGDYVKKEDLTTEHIVAGIVKPVTIPATKVIVTIFADKVLLEEKDSPYEHGEFPFVPYLVYYLGEDDIPAGVIRDLKDLQREINKRRSQSINILNTQMNSGMIYEQGAIDKTQKENFKKLGTTPGVMLEVMPGGLQRIKMIDPAPAPAGEIQMLQETVQAMKDESGVNESMLGSDIPSGTSGKAIELRQKAAITHIGGLFDNQRRSKLQVMFRLWGRKNKKGIIQQYYTEERTFRIIGDNGKQDFMTINKQVPDQDSDGNAVWRTLNDMSTTEFDIVVSDTPAASTQRIAQFWALTDAVSKLGIPGDMVFDILIDLCDLPQKEEIKKRWQERQQAQQQAAGQAQEKVNASLNFKDLPPDGQQQFAAKLGIQLSPQSYGGMVAQGQGINSQTQPQAQQQEPGILQQVIQSLPTQVLQQLAQLAHTDIQKFAQTIAYIEKQLPQQVQQQIAQEVQRVQPQQLIQILYSMIVQALQQGSSPTPPSNMGQQQSTQNQPQTMTKAAMQQVAGDMNPSI